LYIFKYKLADAIH